MEQRIEHTTKSKNVTQSFTGTVSKLMRDADDRNFTKQPKINSQCYLPSDVILLINKIRSSIKESDYILQAKTFIELGDYYCKQREYLYAAAIYNYVLNIYRNKTNDNPDNEKHIIEKLALLEEMFIESLDRQSSENLSPYSRVHVQHREYLAKLRIRCKQQLVGIDQKYPFTIYDEEKATNKEGKYQQLQLEKAELIHKLYHDIAEQLKAFIRTLVQECIAILGDPPCEYAIIGLGSLAREEATPYSDLEFAILIKEENEEYKIYFRNLTKLLHFKVINLGETILPSMAIPALNNFHTKDPADNWFHDEITPKGFAYDAAMPQACKTPLGKKDVNGNVIYELIHTPHTMAKFLGKKADDSGGRYWFDTEPHLSMVLITTTLLEGQSHLLNEYQQAVAKALSNNLTL